MKQKKIMCQSTSSCLKIRPREPYCSLFGIFNFVRYNNCVNFLYNFTAFLHTVCELSREKNINQYSVACMHCLPISGHVMILQRTVSSKVETIVVVMLSAPGAVLQLLTWERNIYKWICCQSIFCIQRRRDRKVGQRISCFLR